MWKIQYTDEFERQYQQLPLRIQKKVEKQERLFRENPFHPSLHTEKLIPKQRELWSIRVDLHIRMLFRFLNSQTIILLAIGSHDRIYRL